MVRLCFGSGLAIALVAFFATSAGAGKFNPVLDIGDRAPAWKALPGTDGKQHALRDFKDKDVLVVVFTCNSCPYAQDYEDRLVAFAKQHAGPKSRVGLVAINVNTIEEDRLPKMKERAKEKGFAFAYLFDESQQIAKDYGAGYTPEFFVLDKERRVRYMGSMDDSPDAKKVKVRHVEAAVSALLAGKRPETAETVPIGCRIRLKRRRKPGS
jgi:peroxiredoxin